MNRAGTLKTTMALLFFAAAVFATPAMANELWVAPARNPANKLLADFAAAQEKAHFGFGVPDTFNGFTKATVLLIGSKDQRIRYDLTLSISQHLASDTASVTVMKDIPAIVFENQLLELDVSAIFNGAPALQPGTDYVSLSIDVSDARAEHDREREGGDERAERSSNDTRYPHAFLFGLRFQYAGPSGTAGPQGPKGDRGPQGPAGATGPQGSTGPTGRQGLVGPTGATGLQGRTGATGPQGLLGPTGPQGPAGATGAQGLTGAMGLTGATGEPGPSGPAGTKGLNAQGAWSDRVRYVLDDVVTNEGQTWRCSVKTCSVEIPPTAKDPDWELLAAKGADGANGGQGPQGPSGLPGPAGANGLNGDAGPAGPSGPAGAKGLNPQGPWKQSVSYALDDVVTGDGQTWRCSVATCPVEDPPKEPDWELLAGKGADGAAGAPGLQGPVGPRGPNGFNGGPGPTGPSGAAGATGPQGPQGAIGPQGPQGATGPQGPPGSSARFQIAEDFNVPGGEQLRVVRMCPSSFPNVVSGGAFWYSVSKPNFVTNFPGTVIESTPVGTAGWSVAVDNTSVLLFVDTTATFGMRVICSN